MKNDYNKRLNNLKQRRETDKILKKSFLSESFDKTAYNESLKYVLEAMKPIPFEYNQNTFTACERVQKQLEPELNSVGFYVSFRYQGSIVTDTNIKIYSDVDQLVIIERFYWVSPPLVVTLPYAGSPTNDVLELRNKVKSIIEDKFRAVTVDDSKGKCTTIDGGSLNRKIDLISCSWVNTQNYELHNDEDYRGIKIYDKKEQTWIENYPFMHAYFINKKDSECYGNLKKLIRLLKTLKVDSDNKIDISSYDIAALAYNMPDKELQVDSSYPLLLLKNCEKFFNEIANYDQTRNSLQVPNKTRKIFGTQNVTLNEFLLLFDELKNAIQDIEESMPSYLFGPLEKSIINY
ncbi:MAG: hypothetical protein JSS63_13810 [Bacteroidetes bacterium]|nr:hypothetical protein [Bacteroidota bacterium]